MKLMSLDLPQLQKERGSLARAFAYWLLRGSGTLSSVVRVWSVLCGQLTLAETHLHWLRLSLTPRLFLSKIFTSACYVLDALLGLNT